jgi:hypothetical protein
METVKLSDLKNGDRFLFDENEFSVKQAPTIHNRSVFAVVEVAESKRHSYGSYGAIVKFGNPQCLEVARL